MRNYLTFSVLSILVISCATPKAQFVISGDTKAPSTIQFENQSTNADTYVWNFGDLGTSNEASPNFAFPRAGNYLVSLKAQKGKKEAIYYERVNIEGPQACLVKIETEFGDMIVQLSNATPNHQANFLQLAEEGFYNDLLFHRVMNGFMIQGGDPQSKNAPAGKGLGSGGPGYTIPAEFVDTLVHVKGALAAARTPDRVNPKKNSSGSQFYLVHGRKINERTLNEQEAKQGYKYSPTNRKAYLEYGGAQFLDGEYTVFGQVIEGLDVIDKIAQSRTDSRNRPQKDVKMKISVIDYFPDKKRP